MPAQNVSMMFSPYSAEAQDIERRRRIAEALQMQGMQPIEQQPTPAGGFAVPISPLQGFAKIAQSLMGGYGQRRSMDEMKGLGERYAKDRSAAVTQALAAGAGTPEQPEKWTGEAADELYTPAQAAVAPDRTKVYQALAASQFPDLQNLGIAQMLKAPDSPWSKIDPKDYTPESVQRFAATLQSGQTPNPSILVPVRKKEAISNVAGKSGPETRFVDPFNPPEEPIQQAVRSEVGPAGQVYNPYQQQPGSVLPDPNKPFQAKPGGGQQPNLPYQQYEKEKAAAGRPQVQTQVNVPPPSKVFENENKLRDDYTVASKPFVGIRDAYNTIKASLAGPITAVSTLAGATKFMKMIDPESVVRESELQMALKAAGLWDRFTNLHNWVMKGQVLTPTQATQIREIADVLYSTASQQQQKLDQYYGGLATQYGLEPARVTRNQSAVMAGPQSAGQPTKNILRAVNPQTGQRIESVDGGQTWRPAGGQ